MGKFSFEDKLKVVKGSMAINLLEGPKLNVKLYKGKLAD